jgi:serine/threonine protein kinase
VSHSDAFQEARALVFQALELAPGAREGFVRRVASSEEVAELVLELLAETGDPLQPDGTQGRETKSLVASPPVAIPGYRLLGVLGSGGMGTVYQAEQESTGLEVAIKVLRSGLSASHQRRFRREWEALRKLDHPHLARFLESGWVEDGEQRRPFFAMEIIDGPDLRQYLRDAQPRREAVVQILQGLADALHHAHQQGVVHRDLKPENILVDRNGQARIVDFGIAHITDFDKSVTTIHSDIGQILGTLQYMSPEQVSAGAQQPGPASDIYALGLIAYEALSGKLPYDIKGHSIPESVALIHTAPIPWLRQSSRDFPEDLDRVLQAMLQRDPKDRYVDVARVRDDLGRVLRGERIRVRTPRRRRNLRRIPVIAGLAVAILGSMWWLTDRRGRPDPETASARQVIFERIDELDRRRHTETLPDQVIRDIIEFGGSILQDIAAVPRWPSGSQLKRYVLWRLGELHYFLGSRHMDYAELDINTQTWEDACEIHFDEDKVRRLECHERLKRVILDVPDYRPYSGLGLSYMLRSYFRDPLRNASLAAYFHGEAWHLFAERTGYRLDSETPQTDLPDRNLGMQLNELGHTWAYLGYLSADADTLARGIELLEQEYRLNYLQHDPSSRGSVLHNLSEACHWRSLLEGRQEDAVRSIAIADSALQVRTRATGLRTFAHTEQLRARSILRLHELTGVSPDVLDETIAGVRLTLNELEAAGTSSPTDIASQRATLGRLLAVRALMESDQLLAQEARYLTNSARRMVAAEEFPHQRSLLAVDQAEVLVPLLRLSGNEEYRDEASDMLREAARLTVRSQHAALHQRIGFIERELREGVVPMGLSN